MEFEPEKENLVEPRSLAASAVQLLILLYCV